MTDSDNSFLPEDDASLERLRRWRLVLGEGVSCPLNAHDQHKDQVLGQLYNRRMMQQMKWLKKGRRKADQRRGGMEASIPDVDRWLGDIRKYFPETVVHVMQQDAIDAIGLRNLLTHREILEQIQPDVRLVATLLSLKDVIPAETKDSARLLVRQLVDALMHRLENKLRQAIYGALNRAQRTRRPRHHDIDWNRTIRANLKHYQPDYRSIIPETLFGFGRRKREAPHHIILCVDQSGSMMASMVYASVFAAVMASIPVIRTHMIVFDTSVVDMTAHLQDPVDLLFGAALGGGTDINQAIMYCQTLITRPRDTTLILISDLYEGGNKDHLRARTKEIIASGVSLVCLLALNDTGAPAFNRDLAGEIAAQGAPAFACTPDVFPELMAAALNRKDLRQWAVQRELKVVPPRDHHSTT